MQFHQLKPIHKKKKKKRIGRGGKRGTYSGRGIKGQKSRAGARFQPAIRSLIKKYPKLRGYRFNPRASKIAVINIEILDKAFKEKDEITPKALLKKGLIRKIKGKVPEVKILSRGEIKKSLIIKDCQASKQARAKIEKAGGKYVV